MSILKKPAVIVILSVSFLILFIFGLYIWKVAPVKAEVDQKRQQLNSEREIVDALQTSNAKEDIRFETTVELQKKLPVKALVQQILLDIEKAEIISDSFVKSMELTEEKAEVDTTVMAEEEADAPSDGSNTEAEENGSGPEEATGETEEEETIAAEDAEQLAEEILPAGMEKVTIEMVVQSPTYEELRMFLGSLESMERILNIEAIEAVGRDELYSIEQEQQSLEFKVIIAGYYAPVLKELEEDLPFAETDKPSGKKNPTYQSPSAKAESDEEA